MGTKILIPPTQLVSTADLRTHLRYTTTSAAQDAELVGFLEAAREAAEHYSGRSIGSQTVELALDEFPDDAIYLPHGPVSEIVNVRYVDTAGTERTMSNSLYALDNYSFLSWLLPSYTAGWPYTLDAANVVKVRYIAGIDPLPYAVKAALMMYVSLMDEKRSAAVGMPAGTMALLDTIKKWS